MIKFVHLVHSLSLENGGVAEAVKQLNDESNNIGVHSRISDKPSELLIMMKLLLPTVYGNGPVPLH